MLLRDWLHEHRKTARELSIEIGIHESILSRVMTMTQPPSYIVVRTIHEHTGGAVSITDWPFARVERGKSPRRQKPTQRRSRRNV